MTTNGNIEPRLTAEEILRRAEYPAATTNETIKRTIEKDAGYGPYLYVLTYDHPNSPIYGKTLCVFSRWEDMAVHKAHLEGNGFACTWEIAVDRTSRLYSDAGEIPVPPLPPEVTR